MMRQNHPNLSLSISGSRFAVSALRRFGLFPAAALLLFTPMAHAGQDASVAATRTTLASAAAESGTGTTLTATVRGADGSTVTSGVVSFLLPTGQSLGSVPVNPDGTAVLQTSNLPTGKADALTGTPVVNVQAQYENPSTTTTTSNYQASASSTVAVATPAADPTSPPTFTATAAPTSVTTTAGQFATTTVTVNSVSGYTAAIGLSCTNLPEAATCSFNPVQQTLAADGSITATLQIQTVAPGGSTYSMLNGAGSSTVALALLLPGALALFGFSGRRRRLFKGAAALQMLGCALLLTGSGMLLSGCNVRYNYKNHGPSPTPGTPAGTYTLQIAVVGSTSSAAIQQNVPVTLTVQ